MSLPKIHVELGTHRLATDALNWMLQRKHTNSKSKKTEWRTEGYYPSAAQAVVALLELHDRQDVIDHPPYWLKSLLRRREAALTEVMEKLKEMLA